MPAFNFASRASAYRRLVQGLSRSVSAFSNFIHEYLDPVVKADQCAQYVDDIGIAADNATDLTRNIRAVFQCIRNAGLKLTIEKCHFGVRQVEFLGRTISSEGVSPQTHKIQNFLNKLRFPKSNKVLQRYLGFVNYYRNYIPRMAEKLNPFYKLLKAEVPINNTSELKETFDSVNKALSDACELALKQPIPGKQLFLMTDASFRSAVSCLLVDLRKINTLIEDDYSNTNHPVSTLSDAAQHLAGKSLFCKPDCSQAYHCLQMADQRSVKLLAFNFASKTFAYKRSAQGLSRSVSAFSSCMREYLDPVVKANQCTQNVDDFGIAANNAMEFFPYIRAVFKCIRQAGLKLTIEKCHFRVRQVEFLGRTTSSEEVSPQSHKIQKFLGK